MLQRSISNFRVKFFPEGLADPAEPLMEFDGALTYVRETLKFHGEDITSFQVTDAHGDVTRGRPRGPGYRIRLSPRRGPQQLL